LINAKATSDRVDPSCLPRDFVDVGRADRNPYE